MLDNIFKNEKQTANNKNVVEQKDTVNEQSVREIETKLKLIHNTWKRQMIYLGHNMRDELLDDLIHTRQNES